MKKILILFTALLSVLTFSSCANLNNDASVAYSMGSIAGSWKGDEKHCKLIGEFLIQNAYVVEGLTYRTQVDEQMISLFDGKCESLNKLNMKGDLVKVLHDQNIKNGQLTFEYGLLKSVTGTLKKITVVVSY